MKLTDLLDQIDRLDHEATKGPWEIDPSEGHAWAIGNGEDGLYVNGTDKDAEFIALARTFAPAAAKALRAVMELHKTRVHDEDPTSPFCNICGPVIDQSCETLQAITDALEAEHG